MNNSPLKFIFVCTVLTLSGCNKYYRVSQSMNEIKDSTFYCWTPVEELPLKVGESRVVCAEVGAYADVKACAKTLNASTETTPEDKQIEEEITSCMKSKGWLRTEALINY